MTLREFEDLLERYGGNLASWPAPRRAGADALVQTSDAARRALCLMREIESVLRAPQRIEAPAAEAMAAETIAAQAVRQRQLTPARLQAARVGWVGAAAAALVFGILVGNVWPDREISPDRLMAASFAPQGVVDVD